MGLKFPRELLTNRRIPVLPKPRDLHRIAILLDIDGTLLDIAPTPGEVQVPESLRRALVRLHERTGGALALVSGRPLADIDAIFAPLRLPAIGGHGAELRPVAQGGTIEQRAAALDAGLKLRLSEIAARHGGVIVEDKGYAVALHYRAAPKEGPALVQEVQRACQAAGDRSIELLDGKAVIEVKSAAFNKGTAVRELMRHRTFRGRAPIFIGDDKTDEHAFAVVPEFGGQAMSVGRGVAGVEHCFDTPAEVRRWLERLAEGVTVSS
jgi:trehalose 6-phosphate phosphatase